MLIRESYLDQLRPLICEPTVKVLTGLRGSGKSTIFKMVQDMLVESGIPADNIISLNLERMESAEINNDRRLFSYVKYRMVQSGPRFVFLDEIEMVDQWELAIVDLAQESDCDLYLAASGTGRVPERLNELLPGRVTEIRVAPLSFVEFGEDCRARALEGADDRQQLALEYIRRGGLPILTGIADEATSDQASLGVYRSILYQDVVLRNRIRDAELLNRILKFVLTHVGKIYAVKSIGDLLKSRNQQASAETIANYLRAMEEAGLIWRVPRFDIKTGAILHNNVKYYLADHGLLRIVTGQQDRNMAGILQNAVFLELKRRGFQVMTGKLGAEAIDFVAEKDGRRIYLQVLERRGSPDVIAEAAGPLQKVKNPSALYIIARDAFRPTGLEGIRCLSFVDFLMINNL